MNAVLLFAALAVQGSVDPMNLPIGTPGKVTMKPATVANMANGQTASIADIVKAASGKSFVYLGESHTNPEHHVFQAQVIDALSKSGRYVVVGFEMFQRPKQDELNPWTMGWESEQEFVQKSDWKKQWGYDFALYRPIFQVTKMDRIPMVALNIPRDWVRTVGKSGFTGLNQEQKAQLPPDLGTKNPAHRQVFNAMIGDAHPMNSTSMDNMYSAQVLWDEAMADSALKYLSSHPLPSSTAFVVVAGSGHVMYGQGINWRVKHRSGKDGVTVVMVEGGKPITVSKGIADFVYCGGTLWQTTK